MLNRRQALISGSSLVLSPVALTSAGENMTDSSVSHSLPTPEHAVSEQTAEHCISCAAACSEMLDSSDVQRSFAETLMDCRDICMVTATILSRTGPMSPAIRQACADACRRVVLSPEFRAQNPSQQDSISICMRACLTLAASANR